MSLPPPKVQRSFADAVLAAGELFPPGDRYRGLAKTRLHGYLVGAACNIGRWLRLEAWRRQRAQAQPG